MGVVDLPQGDVEAALTGHQPDRGQIGANLRRQVLSLAPSDTPLRLHVPNRQ